MEERKLDLVEPAVELIRRVSTELPEDAVQALEAARDREEEGSAARGAFDAILENIKLSREGSSPICQDTGWPIFEVHHPMGYSQRAMAKDLEEALRLATEKSYLRPNAVDPVTGKNSGDNVGDCYPTVHFHEHDEDEVTISLMLKGGGSENVGVQYKLPDGSLGAGRDLEGVRRCVLDAIWSAQGKGCAPGVIGVGIGGCRNTSFQVSKAQFLRKLGDTNPDSELDDLEKTILGQANELGIGPMGFGGKTTVLDVKIGKAHRAPACYFVSVSYLCWAARRGSMTIRNGEVTHA